MKDRLLNIKQLKEAIEYYENLAVVEGTYAHHRRDECLDGLYKSLEKLEGGKQHEAFQRHVRR